MADRIGTIAKKLMRDDPALTQEEAWARAHDEHAKEVDAANEIRAKVISLVRANPSIVGGSRPIQAQQTFDVAKELERERTRLMREGRSLEEAVTEAHELVQARLTSWRDAQLRAATAAGGKVVPMTKKKKPAAPAKPAPKGERFVPNSMTPVEAATAAAAGRLPMRDGAGIRSRSEHTRMMRMVDERIAQGEDYTAAFIAVTEEIANEKIAAATMPKEEGTK